MKPSPKKPNPPRVALLVESSRNYGREVLLGVAQYVRAHGPWSIEFQEGDPARELPGWFKRWRGDGIIARVMTPAMAGIIHKLGVPTVDLYGGLPGLKLARIRGNGSAAGRLAAQHLLERGFRRFAFCGFKDTDWSARRQAGFMQCVSEAGFPCEVFHAHGPSPAPTALDYEEHGPAYERELAHWLVSLPKPAGLMACNAVRGRQVLDACRAVNLAVPDEVAVIGADWDEVLCELSQPPLSSVILNTRRVGYEAAALLDRMLAGEKPPAEVIEIDPLGIATCRSTDVLAVEDPKIGKALLFIRDNVRERLSIAMVARFAGLSQSALKRKFRALMKESVHDAIVKGRLKRACELLSGTDLPLLDIAEMAGFKHSEYMGAVFKARLDQTPAQYRKETNLRQLALRFQGRQPPAPARNETTPAGRHHPG